MQPKIFATALALVAVVALGLISARGNSSATQLDKPRLKGSRAVVDAGEFDSLHAALKSVATTGGIVQIPPGKFEIDQPLVILQEDILIRGSGTSSHIINQSQDGKPAILIGSPDRPNDQKQWRVQLSDLRITGNPKSGAGIWAHRIDEIYIDGVTVSYNGTDGIVLDHCYEDPRICNSLITYNAGTGLNLIGCHDIVVSGNQFEENQDALHCIDGFNLCMNGNNLDDHLGNGVVIENTYGSVLAGNMIEECKGTAVVLDRDCYGITVSANVIAHNFSGGVELKDAHGCAISANTFTIVPKNGLIVRASSGRITITGNSFSDSYIGESTEKRRANDQGATGVILESTKDITLVGNTFSGLSAPAIQSAQSQRVLVNGNLFAEVETRQGELGEDSLVNSNLDGQ